MESYSPASLPAIRSVDVVVLNFGVPLSIVGEWIGEAVVRSVNLTGEAAQLIASLWRQLPPGGQYPCHLPPYGLRFYSSSGFVCEASACWRCNNIFGQGDRGRWIYQFDAKAPASRQLLAVLQQAVGDEPSELGR